MDLYYREAATNHFFNNILIEQDSLLVLACTVGRGHYARACRSDLCPMCRGFRRQGYRHCGRSHRLRQQLSFLSNSPPTEEYPCFCRVKDIKNLMILDLDLRLNIMTKYCGAEITQTTNNFYLIMTLLKDHRLNLIPRPLPRFQCCTRATLKTWKWPEDEAT